MPNDFADYDEVWAHVLIHGTNGSPTSGSVQAAWQVSHPQAGGGYHDQNPIWNDISYKYNSHLFHSGLTFPLKLARTVPASFNPMPEYIRGIRLATGRIRLKLTVTLAGGTDPSYIISLAIYARRATADMKPILNIKTLTQTSTLYDYVRDIWGYSIRNKDAALGKVLLKNGATGGPVLVAEHLQADGSVVKQFDRPIRFESGVFLETSQGGSNGFDITLYTSDNVDS
ncbi:hypothetical protein [Priestia megaterium]|uniref:hypothetical protein n=1 Tax=Priestia megaterium TaxID=1404 RepID=UPI002E1C5B2E|nr:hypothetical protein [Priestia megaterium]